MRVATRRAALLLTLGLASTSLGLAAGPVSAAANGCKDPTQSCVVVTVVSTEDFKKTTKRYEYKRSDLSTLPGAIDNPAYFTRTRPAGEPAPTPRPAKSVPLRDLLTDIGTTNPEQATLKDDATFSEAPDATGIPRVLDKPAFGDPNGKDYPFDDNLQPALYAAKDGQIGYFRPLTGEDDVNVSDKFLVKGRLDLTIHTTGKLLAPTATISNSAPSTKDKPTFSVSLSEKPGTRLQYRWDFGDDLGPGRTSKSPSHRYTKKGTYGAFVTVRGADGSYGRSAVLEVKVAKPPKPPKTPATTGSGGGGGVTGGSGGYVPPYTPPSTNLPEPDAVDDPPVEEPTPDVPVDDGLVDVEGYVLAGSEIVPGGTPETIPGTQASSSPTPASKTSVRKQIATWAVAALAIVLLVGAGATSETRWFRNRLRHLRRRA